MARDILIVDDEADIRMLIAGVLGDEGFTTRDLGTDLAAKEDYQGALIAEIVSGSPAEKVGLQK